MSISIKQIPPVAARTQVTVTLNAGCAAQDYLNKKVGEFNMKFTNNDVYDYVAEVTGDLPFTFDTLEQWVAEAEAHGKKKNDEFNKSFEHGQKLNDLMRERLREDIKAGRVVGLEDSTFVDKSGIYYSCSDDWDTLDDVVTDGCVRFVEDFIDWKDDQLSVNPTVMDVCKAMLRMLVETHDHHVFLEGIKFLRTDEDGTKIYTLLTGS